MAIILFNLFCLNLNPLLGRDIQYVRTTKAVSLTSLESVQFEIRLEQFNSEDGIYLAKLTLPSTDWNPPNNFTTFVHIPNLKVQRVPAIISQCENLVCSVKVKYPTRGFDNLSAFIEISPKDIPLVQIPIEAILSPNGEEKFVYIAQNNLAIKKRVELIDLNGLFGVTKDISNSEDIIIFGQERLIDGENIEVIF